MEHNPEAGLEQFEVTDYEDEIFYDLLKTLPREVAIRSIAHIERNALSDEEATEYLASIIEQRVEVSTETEFTDTTFEEALGTEPEMFLTHIETELFNDTDKQIGHGRTAKVHSTRVKTNDSEIAVAVKYLISPIKGTLSASQEHDVIREVERIEVIERMEHELNKVSKNIRVPHPYFKHKTDKLQCYGMQEIDGSDLERLSEGAIDDDTRNAISNALATIDIEYLEREIDAFFDVMHEYCLHGDIKPKNIMVGKDGTFYIIDFGQSVLANDIPEKALDQLNNLQEDEKKQTKIIIRNIVQDLLMEEKAVA